MEFHNTLMGSKFYEGTMPSIAKNLERIAQAQEEANELQRKANELKEREVACQERLLQMYDEREAMYAAYGIYGGF